MKSAIFKGSIRHRRMSPVEHSFDYSLFMMYLDLAELPHLFKKSRLFSAERRSLARFCREDHLGDPAVSLDRSVRDLVEQQSGRRPSGPIRLLTHLRYFGYVFNPVSFFYCFDERDEKLETIVAEVNNTPWKERYCYVLSSEQEVGIGQCKRYQPVKQMHVSPFMPMEVDYDWRFTCPGDSLTVHMENSCESEKVFDATLVLRRQEISAASLAGVLLAFPLMTLKVLAAIHWQALKLWLKGSPVHDHPDKKIQKTFKDDNDQQEAITLKENIL